MDLMDLMDFMILWIGLIFMQIDDDGPRDASHANVIFMQIDDSALSSAFVLIPRRRDAETSIRYLVSPL